MKLLFYLASVSLCSAPLYGCDTSVSTYAKTDVAPQIKSTITKEDLYRAIKNSDKLLLQECLEAGIPADCEAEDKKQPLEKVLDSIGSSLVYKNMLSYKIIALLCTAGAQVKESYKKKSAYTSNESIRELLKDTRSPSRRLLEALRTSSNAWDRQSTYNNLLIKIGARGTSTDELGRTPLMLAALQGSAKVVRLLFENGADPRIQDKNGLTALAHASVASKSECADYIANACKNALEIADRNGNTPLLLAVQAGNLDTIEVLLRHGAKFTAVNKNLDTSIILAYVNGHLHLIPKLLGLGVDVNAKNKQGEAVLTIAARLNDEANMKMLICYETVADTYDNEGKSPLWWAIESRNKKMITLLLKAGAWPKNNEFDPIVFAQGPDRSLIELLASYKSCNEPDHKGMTKLHHAVLEGKDTTVEELLKGLAYIDAQDKEGMTPLMHAAKTNNKIAKMLINAGAKTTLKNMKGETVFQIAPALRKKQGAGHTTRRKRHLEPSLESHVITPPAAAGCLQDQEGNEEKEKELNDVGLVQPNKASRVDSEVEQPRMMSMQECVKTLVSQVQLPDATVPVYVQLKQYILGLFFDAVKRGDKEGVDSLIALGINTNVALNGTTGLHIAAQGVLKDMINHLVFRDATIDARDAQGMTPLMIAATHSWQTAHACIQNHARLDICDLGGRTVLICAAQAAQQSKSLSMLIELVSYAGELDMSVKDRDGKTFLDYLSPEQVKEFCLEVLKRHAREQR